MANVPPRVAELIETFDRNIDAYRSQQYNETQLRREFIDPFFEQLGWDVTNIAGNAQAYKDVIHEDAIKVGSATKAPDYSFRIGGTRKFFLEAKKPSIDIKGDPHPAYQLRRYAWSAKLPLSILTDFEEFAVYDCQTRPKQHDRAGTARIMYLNYKEYIKRWSDIESIFSKDAIYKGSFDKFAVSTKGKRGTTTVDIELLAEIEKWRKMLAGIIALRNRTLTKNEINFAVQRTIDRILFLRMCEDRAIEDYGQLLKISTGDRTYPRLCELFEKADHKYNSGLFYFQKEPGRATPPDDLTPNITIDDKDLKYILHSLYYPLCPYEFSVLPPEILGNVYEQFLGSVITISGAHRANVVPKPEVKKAGGVYYTPSYIVDYIVKNTVGRLLECHCEETALQATRQSQPSIDNRKSKIVNRKPLTPKQISKLRILDPACGSGSFLLGAYTYLLNYHRDWYVENSPEKYTKKIYQGKGGQWFLTIAEKKQILLNNIFGVDIDSQAVEVTKLSLLLKVLENESQETLRLFHERALPDLGNNIKCGNSLIGPDFYEDRDPDTIDPEEYRRINPFDYKTEFPQIFKTKTPGFNAVIGNPPYVRVRQLKTDNPALAAHLETKYRCATHVWDVYLLFFEKALSLIASHGSVSYIVPIQTLHQPNCESLRNILVNETAIVAIANLSQLKVFQKAIVKNCIIVAQKPHKENNAIAVFEPREPTDLAEIPFDRLWPQDSITQPNGYSLKTDLLSVKSCLCEKIAQSSHTLGELFYVTFGLRSCAKGKGRGGKDRLVTTNPRESFAKPYLEGREIRRYSIAPSGRFIKYIPEEMYSPRDPKLFETKKIVSQTMLSRMELVATLDTDRFYVEQSLLCVIPHGILTPPSRITPPPLEFALGILNSKLASFYYKTTIIDYSLGGGLVHATPGAQGKIPIPKINMKNKAQIAKHDKMVKLVDRMLDLHKRLSKVKVPAEKTRIQRQISTTDKQIDKLTYDLYNLTAEEIKIVEDTD